MASVIGEIRSKNEGSTNKTKHTHGIKPNDIFKNPETLLGLYQAAFVFYVFKLNISFIELGVLAIITSLHLKLITIFKDKSHTFASVRETYCY